MNDSTRFKDSDGPVLVCADCRFGYVDPPPTLQRVCRNPEGAMLRDPINGWLPTCKTMRDKFAPCGPGGALFELAPQIAEDELAATGPWITRLWHAFKPWGGA
ncbi:hypothetical protein KPB04_27905 [Burkholderia cenocepacia]|uniref:hypothetical protein n=1 Tax=Burkholderia cenocepacia TaxID=95486 RepID=UPI002862451F|nr:hypothetical protein [Burkholderia cenocepacia]MDR8105563.1 hypothetical protein [Burkholderia cenocepacia]